MQSTAPHPEPRSSLMNLPRPGCLVRSTLALLGVLFVPLAIWFAVGKGRERHWLEVGGLLVAAVICFVLAFRRSEWMDALDDI